MAGIFITFEGIDGSGKSTQIALFSEYLKTAGHDVVLTREPGGTRASEAVRKVFLDPHLRGMNVRTETLLVLAARAQIVAEVIRPALEQGKTVLSDRFFDSTFAYQGGGRGLAFSEIEPLNQFACAGLVPQMTYLVDISTADSAARLKKAGKSTDRMEAEGQRFQENVRQAYHTLAKRHPGRFVMLDGAKPAETLHKQIVHYFRERFPVKKTGRAARR